MSTPPDKAPVRLPAATSTPLLTVAALRAVESAALAEAPPTSLMAQAGRSAARLGRAVAPHSQRVVVLCGPGNNGGDGLVCATALHVAGARVTVHRLDPDRPYQGDAAWACQEALSAGVPVHDGPLPELGPADLVVDALFGIGANRAPAGRCAEWMEWINRSPATVLALDMPTGLDADTGAADPRLCVQADHTLTFIAAKPGLFTAQGRDHAGMVWCADLGLGAAAARHATALLGPATPPGLAALQGLHEPRRHADHKGSFGDVVVMGGANGMSGAAVLAAHAAAAAGAGRVYLGLLESAGGSSRPGRAVTHSVQPEVMQLTTRLSDAATWQGRTAVVGCGGGQAVAADLPAALHHAPRLVLDADALNAIAADPGLRRQLASRAQRGLATVATPHPLEAARLLGVTTPEVQANRLAYAQALARELHAVVVLKGSGTVVAQPEGLPWVNATGSAALATAGSGDVLAGWMGGRWSAASACSAFDVAVTAVCEHGAAVAGVQAGPMLASALVQALWRSRAGGWA